MEYRIEHDSMGEMKVPADRYWGAQTQRSHENFPIGVGIETMPQEIIHAFGILKLAAARANHALKPEKMTDVKLAVIEKAASEVISGRLNSHFPLVVWQTGSGTQSNMNANEVIAGRANELAGEKLVHPNDDVNMSQSSNDTFPTAMHIAAVCAMEDRVLPAIDGLVSTFLRLEAENEDAVKSGRTHLQDAVPISFAQEISGWRSSLQRDRELLELALRGLQELALGGTAVGTGLNAPKGFDVRVAEEVSLLTGRKFVTAGNKFHALTSKDELVFAHGALKALACDMMKIANDVRWLASGPRDGLGEIFIPENEPGSSIMPGKVNPTQCEAVTMVAVQVMGNDTAVGIAASQGNFELNVFMPVLAYNFLQSARLLAEAIASFHERCAAGIRANREKMHGNLYNSLMLVTALNPYIGYENAAKTAKKAFKENISLKQACVELGFLTAERFDEVFHPEQMIGSEAFSMTYSYFPGCTLKTKGAALDRCGRAAAQALGFSLEELPEWQCCGAVYPMAKDEIAVRLSSVRALDAARAGGGKLVTLCSACYHVLKRVNGDLQRDPDIRRKVNSFLGLETPYTGQTQVLHYLEVLRDELGWDALREKVTKPLTGRKIGAYYGCMLLRPGREMRFDDPENPTVLEDFLRAIGAEPVIYAMRNECCGGYTTLENNAYAARQAQKVLDNARSCGADCLITACPLCLYNLTRNTDGSIPVRYFTELLAEALGLEDAAHD